MSRLSHMGPYLSSSLSQSTSRQDSRNRLATEVSLATTDARWRSRAIHWLVLRHTAGVICAAGARAILGCHRHGIVPCAAHTPPRQYRNVGAPLETRCVSAVSGSMRNVRGASYHIVSRVRLGLRNCHHTVNGSGQALHEEPTKSLHNLERGMDLLCHMHWQEHTQTAPTAFRSSKHSTDTAILVHSVSQY